MDTDTLVRRPGRPDSVVPSGELAMMLFILTELMFFAGLISVFLVLRADSTGWPPPDQPRLPVEVTGANTLVLLASGVAMALAVTSSRHGRRRRMLGWLVAAAATGALFLMVQGSEWARLVRYGLTMTSSLYGGTFYVLIGAHGLHVAGALVALAVVLARALRGGYRPGSLEGLRLCRMYWWFVVGIWPVLYLLVYF